MFSLVVPQNYCTKLKKMNLNNAIFFLSICFCNYFQMGFSSNTPNDASALLNFKSQADLNNNLNFSNTTIRHFCKWNGVSCSSSRAVKLVIENKNLGGVFGSKTLTRLTELRVLSLINNSLTGPIPDLSGLLNLKVLFLSRNYLSGSIPASISSLHRLKTLDLSYNMLSGSIGADFNHLDRLYYLRLDFNRFNGSVPPFNLTSLQIFNISHNDLTGAIPVTPTLSRFKTSSFALNPGLCGEVIHKECNSTRPFFNAAVAPPPPAVSLSQTTDLGRGSVELNSRGMTQKHKKLVLIVGFSFGVSFFVMTLVCFAMIMARRRSSEGSITKMPLDGNAETVMRIEEENNELEEKVKSVQLGKQQVQQQQQQLHIVGKSGSLMFCAGEVQVYTLDQLMRASADLLGRGTMGTTYKAVLDSRLIVTVKRLDGARLAGVSSEVFEEHMESVGGLRHPTLVPLRAYFQAKEERLLVYDYLANGSLFSLVHGSKSTKAKPLHWTSCLKIAEDVAQGLSYIHQAWRLVHGNLKSTNILLGSEFEACLTDYCLVALAGPTSEEDENTIAYKAPEILKTDHREANSKCDVYSFGILLLELLSGKFPSQLPSFESDDDMGKWVRSVRDEEGEENRSGMLLEVAMACSAVLPDQRPTMWQVLKMIQEIKEVVLTEDGELVPDSPSL